MHGFNRALRVSFIGLILSDIILGDHYTDLWAVHVEGGEDVARNVAAKHGFVFRGQILPDYYHFQHRKVSKRSTYPSSHYHRNLAYDPSVRWLEQQVAKKRVKREIIFNDPKWPIMWYLNRGGGLDMNVKQAWQQGYTGKGVVVTILDDGIEKDHPDLKKNYDEQASYDVNGHDPDPQPRYDYSNENRHGTRCAGEVAAQADNHICSVGVAYNAWIGGVRMLDGDVTDSVEAQSLGLNPQHIHVYSASWGPDDDGRTVDGPATLARKAFYDGITKGRGGLGSIFVWASGNGGRDGDNCNCDGYTNSIYTLSISSSTENGNVPWYSEACSSTLATTYSSGSGGEKQIVTTDLRKECTETHTGTSASAPLAAGLIALALQANPSMTWRDMQHIVVETAKPDNLNAADWVSNGVGKKVSHSFGFGLMDASAMVSLARNWTTVPPQHICEIRSLDHNSFHQPDHLFGNRVVPMNGKLTVPLYTDGCEGTVNHVKYLEHVQARITMTSSRRGEIQIFLTSPSLTRSTLLAKRTRDLSREGFNNWAFMTTHNWGEPAKGQWTLEIENGGSQTRTVRLRDWVLVLYGTDSHPRKSPTSVRSANNDYRRYDDWTRPHYYPFFSNFNHTVRPPPPTTTTTTTTTTTSTTTTTATTHMVDHGGSEWSRKGNGRHRTNHHRKNWESFIFGDSMNEAFASKSPAYARRKSQQLNPAAHTCVYETLAKKSNLSSNQQYPRNIRPKLTAAELKEWTLVVMGTEKHPLKQNVSTPSSAASNTFTCAGVTSNGICIVDVPHTSSHSSECKPGFFKMEEHCVAHCPEHYFGSVQAVHLAGPVQINSSKPLLHTQGVCKPCHTSCLTCRGPSLMDCFQCASGYERQADACEKTMIWDLLDPEILKHLAWAIILCIGAIIIFFVGFVIMQARERGRLCWSVKQNYIPDWTKGAYNGVSVLDDPEVDTSLSNSHDLRGKPSVFRISSTYPNIHGFRAGMVVGGRLEPAESKA
ncbi:furin-like protease kpc-1 isoform X4 [Pomacea canaliculata]|uniref:furin-like protease kpc-1 isoform X4 n=1 Tax=Pomacea canaliculata TaxID=400727 RepID=UPI000D72537A|nr:furin-like protease kpc-1 isoform X4 [Pomacea canaliculata]